MKISSNITLLSASKGSYVYVVQDKEIVLIDTGLQFRGKAIINEIKSMGIELSDIKHILLTHHDIDHIGNVFMLQQLTGAQVWASQEDIPYIHGDIDRSGFKKYFKYIFRVKVPGNIRPYTPGVSINGIEVVPTPGHTPGHVCLLYKDILFAGDLIENKNGKLRPYPHAWNWDNKIMAESLKSIANLPFKTVCPAHGKPVDLTKSLILSI
jgi:glyoxylase-like metal-dependent hydrolase (beta-lactamase superfamily II)